MKGAGKASIRTAAVDGRTRILGALEKAGAKGLSRSRVGPSRKCEIDQSLETLLREGRIVRLGPLSKALYFLEESAPGVEQAAVAIANGAAQSSARLFLEKELGRFCSRAEAFFLKEAVQGLVQRGILLRLTRGKTSYYIHGGALGRSAAPREHHEFDPRQVRDAYRALVDEHGFLDARIAALASRARTPLEPLQAWLLEESRAGRAHLSRGDWSLASEEERKAAVSLDGRPHLLVRLEQGA